jgi:hypothetical protein
MVKYQLEIQLILFKNMKGGCVMDFFKKLSETVMDTASTISAKSTDMVEIGKLKLQRNQLENAIKDKKTEIGNIVYQAHKQNIQPDETLLRILKTRLQLSMKKCAKMIHNLLSQATAKYFAASAARNWRLGPNSAIAVVNHSKTIP